LCVVEEGHLSIRVEVRLLGVFRGLAGIDRLSLEVERSNVKKMIKVLAGLFPTEARSLLIDPDLDDPRPNALILLNGREINVLNGLETEVTDGDEITLIPVVHGG
jgi:molybdopterin synthase sulfur carrier subunit